MTDTPLLPFTVSAEYLVSAMEPSTFPYGVQAIFRFPNGYGASVVQNEMSYGSNEGLWELGVLKFENDKDYDLCYDTPITDDVRGHLTPGDVDDILLRVAAL